MKLKPSEIEELAQNPKTREKLAQAGLLSTTTKKEPKMEVSFPDIEDTPEFKKAEKKAYTYMDLVWEKKPMRTWFAMKLMQLLSSWMDREIEVIKREREA